MEGFVMLPDREIRDLVLELKTAVKELQENRKEENGFVGNDQFMEIMGISKRTAQTWRDQGVVPFSQIGSKIYYSRRDIEMLMQKHRCDLFVNPKNK